MHGQADEADLVPTMGRRLIRVRRMIMMAVGGWRGLRRCLVLAGVQHTGDVIGDVMCQMDRHHQGLQQQGEQANPGGRAKACLPPPCGSAQTTKSAILPGTRESLPDTRNRYRILS